MLNLHAFTFFQISNIMECGLWILLSMIMAIVSWRTRAIARRLASLAVPILFIFGISDLVEASTGAWWRPWWLFVWKALCVAALLALACTYYRINAAAKKAK